IAEALFPYDGLLIATKGGYERTGPSSRSATGELLGWTPNGRPGHLRSACEASLRRLRLDRIDLYQLHTPDPAVPYSEPGTATPAHLDDNFVAAALQLEQDEMDAPAAEGRSV